MDFLLPYVNAEDPVWRDELLQYAPYYDICRFRDYGTLKYLFRGVEKNMPYIDRIVLILSGPSQIPDWLNQDTVRVVFHKDIIPESLLPIYNSSSIECFINNIKDLSERFIYSNDDMFPLCPLKEESFFRDGRPIINSKVFNNADTTFLRMCWNTSDFAAKLAGVKPEGFVKPAHFFSPMLKSVNDEIVSKGHDEIIKSCSRFRTAHNFNQYLYQDYYVHSGLSIKAPFAYSAKRISFDHPNKTRRVVDAIENKLYDILCINDEYHSKVNAEAAFKKIRDAFEKIFPEKSRFEK